MMWLPETLLTKINESRKGLSWEEWLASDERIQLTEGIEESKDQITFNFEGEFAPITL